MIINKLKFNEIIRLFGVGKKTKDSLVKRNLAPSKVLSGFDNIGDMGVNVKNLRDLRLADIAIPKSDITAISEKTSKNKLANIFNETTFTRIPVYNDTLDNPIGLVHFKDFALRHGFGGAKTFSIKKILRPLIYAPPSMRLDKLMQKMQNERIFMALVIGGTSGYVGGYTDVGIQGTSDAIRMIPTIPLYAAFAATFPKEWSNVQIYFALTSILGFLGWTTLARRIRTHVLATRSEDYILSSKLSGASGPWIIRKHLLPSFTSYIIVDLIISFPYIVLSETALSLIGLGLRRPTISWGVLMQDMTTLQAIQLTPWYFIPLIFFSLAILGFVLVGDGLRQAADPYSQMKR